MKSKKINKSEKNEDNNQPTVLSWLNSEIHNAAVLGVTSESGRLAKIALEYLFSSGWTQHSMEVVTRIHSYYERLKRNGDDHAAAKSLAELKREIHRKNPHS